MRVGFVGAGRMGLPMVRRLVAAGHQVRVLGRSPESRRLLEGTGAQVTGVLARVATGAEAVVVCVYTDEQVREVCLGGALLDELPTGSALVIHTTGRPDTVTAVAAATATRGVRVVDAPVSGGPHDVAAGRLTLFVGGAEDTVARIRPVLSSYGDPVLHVGPLGAGQRIKLINNALFAAHIGLLSDAVRLAAELGVSESVLLSALPHGSADSRALAGAVGRGSVAAFTAAVGEFLAKDLHTVRATAAELGAGLGVLGDACGVLGDALTTGGRP